MCMVFALYIFVHVAWTENITWTAQICMIAMLVAHVQFDPIHGSTIPTELALSRLKDESWLLRLDPSLLC